MYKGKYLYTIEERDIQNPLNPNMRQYVNLAKLLDTMGKLLPCDIGKQVYLMPSGYYQVENDQQLKTRLNK